MVHDTIDPTPLNQRNGSFPFFRKRFGCWNEKLFIEASKWLGLLDDFRTFRKDDLDLDLGQFWVASRRKTFDNLPPPAQLANGISWRRAQARGQMCSSCNLKSGPPLFM